MKGTAKMINSSLSLNTQEMLIMGKKIDTIKGIDNIKKLFIEKGIPLFSKVIEFQERYGGINYKIGHEFYEGFSMDLFNYSLPENQYRFRGYKKIDGKYFFNCMDYHYAGDLGPYIDEDGKIYDFGMGKLFIRADSIEEFLEDEGIKFYFVSKQDQWLHRGAEYDTVCELKNKEFN